MFQKGDRVWFWSVDIEAYGTVQHGGDDVSSVLLDDIDLCIDIQNKELNLLIGPPCPFTMEDRT